MQRAVPAQARYQAAQKSKDDLRTDAFKAMHAAEIADSWKVRIRVAQANGIHREATPIAGHLANDAGGEMGSALFDDALQFNQLG